MDGADVSLDVLLVEDNPGDARLVEHHLNAPHVSDIARDVSITHVESLTDGIGELRQGSYDILFLDLGLPESTGLSTLNSVLEEDFRVPVVVLTGLKDRETAVKAIESGAQDYLFKDNLNADLLARSLRNAVERHRQEEEVRRKNERLNEFASVVSHDLRNPLNVATGHFDFIVDEYDPEHADQVSSALDRMGAIIDDLLTLARQGDTVDDPASVDLASLVDECWANVDTHDADLVVESESVISVDESRVKRLLENLIRNAIEHNEAEVTITVGELDDGSGIFVQDDGAGIPPDERQHVFDTGYTTNRDGTGFGLMIVREIAEAHGWTVDLVDGPDGGARFEFRDVQFVKPNTPA